MNILMLSTTFPYPPTKGGTQVRTFHLLKYLNQAHHVTLLTQRSEEVSDAEIEALREFTGKLVVFEKPIPRSNKVRRFAEFLSEGTPPSVRSNYSPPMQAWIDQHIDQFDVITCEHSVNEIYVRSTFQQKKIVNVHSSVYGSCKNQLQTGTSENQLRDRINLPLLKRYEKRYCRKFTNIVVTTDDDRTQLQRFNPNADFTVIPNGVDFTAFPYRTCDPGGHHLVFIGAMDNLANIDAAKFLSLEILPQLQSIYPDVTLSIVGARPTAEIQQLGERKLGERKNIIVTGRVESIADYLHQATVCVIPMRTGFGIKNKTLEAMAAGTPIVSSDRGLEGLQFNRPIRALQANTVSEYVAAISRLFGDPALRSQLSQNARSLIETEYTWERAGRQYLQVLEGN
ncbi:glycosyltransferase family 4 protein [Leptolyngbya sp. FACHB-17]|uniref:glycosyltransferase family 4 protein n=1 Tax=unclassified Leptolyngbya TaxID=2650499 RepID=UPI001680EC8C|nr:glycosyltransferase family 4 protein [Leptolyngbya sp. FACHB-17]MBD2082598.1 glycosyltransferase [Leptolyngbya sp. FACHB-17]